MRSLMPLTLVPVVALAALASFTSTAKADPLERTIRRTLHAPGKPRLVKIRSTFVRTRNVRIAAAPNPRVARAALLWRRGDPLVRLTPVGAPRGRRVGHTSVVLRGQKWNFNARRWQSFVLRIRVTVHAPGNAPRREVVPARHFERRTRVAVGGGKRGTIRGIVGGPVRKLAMLAADTNYFSADLRGGVLRIRGKRPGRGAVAIGGQYLDPRTRKWTKFYVRMNVRVVRP